MTESLVVVAEESARAPVGSLLKLRRQRSGHAIMYDAAAARIFGLG